MITNSNLRASLTAFGLMGVMLLGNTPVADAQTNSSVQATITFTRDLTLGSSGADVIALQNWLISKGFTIPAGATGYFGGQSAAALAKYQAARGIAPAAGYFGPTTRAKVNAESSTTPTPNPTPGTDTLKGGEADLTDYDLKREDATGNEGQEAEVATASFDVEGGDIRVERLDLTVEGTNTGLTMQPWKYFDRITILANGKEIAHKDVDSRSDWSKSGNGYRLSLTGMKHIVRDGNTAKLTIVADVSDNIDSNNLAQNFTFGIADRGIRAVDAAGIQQYAGSDSDEITFGFGAQENGDLHLSADSDNPDAAILVADANKKSDDYEVLVFNFENKDDVDTLITELAFNVTGMNGGVSASDILDSATLEIDGDEFDGDISASTITFEDMDLQIDGDDEVTGTLSIVLTRNATSTPVVFTLANAGVEAEGVDSGDDASVSGSVSSETHTIALSGVAVKAGNTSATVVTPGGNAASTYGTYSIKFSVTGLEDDAYIASTTADTGTVGALYTIGGNTFAGTKSAILTSTARMENGFYLVREGKTETFTLTVTLDPTEAGIYDVRLNTIRFSDSASLVGSATYTVPTSNDYRTNPIYIAN